MDRDSLLELLSKEDVIALMEELGSDWYKEENNNALIFESICHGSTSHKLYYYLESKTFHCYSGCSCNYSVYDLISTILGLEFSDSYKYLASFLGVRTKQRRKIGFKKIDKNEDLKFLKVNKNKNYRLKPKEVIYSDNVLKVFDNAITEDWLEEGITYNTAEKYELGFYINQNCMTIPVRNIKGELIGIRKRNYFTDELEKGRKYVPIAIQGILYKFPTANSLYGIYQNQNDIRKYKRAILFESEKSVLKMEAMYNYNISLGIYGMNLSPFQADMIKSLEVEEVIIALDCQYEQDKIEDLGTKEYSEFTLYLKKVSKIVKRFEKTSNVSILMDFDNMLEYKDSPIDKGRKIFEKLLKNKFTFSAEELQEIIEEREQS